MKFLRKPLALASILAVVTAAVTLGGSRVISQDTNRIKIGGSSTVYPITEAVTEEFQKQNPTQITVDISGTSGGFQKFCSTDASMRTHISNASRPIKKSEQEACKAAGVEYIELPVAYDAISVVVSKYNTNINDITVAELKKMWEIAGETKGITKWSQIRSGWPDTPFKLYSPDLNSGTYDYFQEAILGENNESRRDFSGSEDDNLLVRGIQNNLDAIGYFGLAYYQANKDKLKSLKINGVAPSSKTVNNGSYTPLSRPIYIYANKAAAQKPEVKAFIDFYLKNAAQLVTEVGYVPLPDADYSKAQTRFKDGQTGRIPLRAGL